APAQSNFHEVLRRALVVVHLKKIRHVLRKLALVHDLPLFYFKRNNATRAPFTLADDHGSRTVFRPVHGKPFVIDVLEIPDGRWAQDSEWVQCNEVIVGGSGLRLGRKFIAFFWIDERELVV